MATNYEKIQEDLAKCNVTLWEPEPLKSVQLSPCRLACLESELENIILKLSAAADALSDIEQVATDSSDEADVHFNMKITSSGPVWSMIPTADGVISFELNDRSLFFKDHIIPSVSTLLVPLTEPDTSGNEVPLSDKVIYQKRLQILRTKPVDVVETTITALNAFKTVVTAKKTKLNADYSDS